MKLTIFAYITTRTFEKSMVKLVIKESHQDTIMCIYRLRGIFIMP